MYKNRKVFGMRGCPVDVWVDLCCLWSGRQDYISYIVDVRPDSDLSKWLMTKGAEYNETVILDMSL